MISSSTSLCYHENHSQLMFGKVRKDITLTGDGVKLVEELQVTEVVGACSNFLIRQLHLSNCLEIRLFADIKSCTQLLQVAHCYTTDHFMEVIDSQKFVLLAADEIAKLLASDDLNIPEELMYQALVLLLRNDLSERNIELSHLLSLIKLPLNSPQFIADHVESYPIFREDSVPRTRIFEALKYHLLPEQWLSKDLYAIRSCGPSWWLSKDLYAVGGRDESSCLHLVEFLIFLLFLLCDCHFII